MMTYAEIMKILDNLRDNLNDYSLSELEDIANQCQDICDDIDKLL